MQEMIDRYGKQASHMLKEFDLDEGKTISKDEFIAVLDDKYRKDAARTAKWVKFLGKPPSAKKEKKVRAARPLPQPQDGVPQPQCGGDIGGDIGAPACDRERDESASHSLLQQ